MATGSASSSLPSGQRVTTARAGSARAEAERLTHWLGGAVEGNRNASLFWAACRLAEHGIDEQGIHDLLDPPALAVGLGAREIEATIRSAWRSAQLTPASDAGGRSSSPVRGAVRR